MSSNSTVDVKETLILNPTSRIGGAEHSLLEFLRQVPSAERSKIVAVLPDDEGELFGQLEDLGYQTVIIQGPRNYQQLPHTMTYVRYINKLIKLIDTYSIKTVYANHIDMGPVLTPLNLVSSNTKTVVHVRDLRGPIGVLYRQVNFQDVIVFNSKFVRDSAVRTTLMEFLMQGKSRVIYNSVNRPAAIERAKEPIHDLSVNDSAKVLGMFGRFVPWKRYDFAIKQCCHPDVYDQFDKFLLVGAGSSLSDERYEESVRRMIARYDDEDKFSVLEFKENVWPYYRLCDAIVVPSKDEPFGRIPIEAGALGIPALVAASGGLREIITHRETGLCFDPNSPEDFREQVLQMLRDDALRHRLGESAQRLVESKFSSERYYEELGAALFSSGDSGH